MHCFWVTFQLDVGKRFDVNLCENVCSILFQKGQVKVFYTVADQFWPAKRKQT